jgi:hypothetical protein
MQGFTISAHLALIEPIVLLIWLVVGAAVVAIIYGLVRIRSTRSRSVAARPYQVPEGAGDIGARLGCLTVALGPAVGLLAGWVVSRFGFVHPLDTVETTLKLVFLGFVAGLVGAIAFLLAGRQIGRAPTSSTRKPSAPPQQLWDREV